MTAEQYVASRAHLPTLVGPLGAKPGEYIHRLLLADNWPRDGQMAEGYRKVWRYEAERQSWRCLEAMA